MDSESAQFYTGVGSRETPAGICDLMTKIAAKLRIAGYTLRSGHAQGADRAFEAGAQGRAVIYLPWGTFGQGPYGDDQGMPVMGLPYCDRIGWLANYQRLMDAGVVGGSHKEAVKLLHGRNVAQVVGHEMPHRRSKFVIGWAPIKGNTVTGGTRIAFEYAKSLGIQVFNLAEEAHLARLTKFAG